jgi:hypothetical protein
MRHHPSWREVRHEYMRNLVPSHASCAICRWWHPESSAAADPVGFCHFNPPTVEGWPETNGDEDVCSFWETDYDPTPRVEAA